jgi:hypothetical protein
MSWTMLTPLCGSFIFASRRYFKLEGSNFSYYSDKGDDVSPLGLCPSLMPCCQSRKMD